MILYLSKRSHLSLSPETRYITKCNPREYRSELQIMEKMSKIPSLSRKILRKINNDIFAFLHPSPCTPGVTVVSPTAENILKLSNLIKLREDKFLDLFLEAREVAHLLSDKLSVERCAIVSYPEQEGNESRTPIQSKRETNA